MRALITPARALSIARRRSWGALLCFSRYPVMTTAAGTEDENCVDLEGKVTSQLSLSRPGVSICSTIQIFSVSFDYSKPGLGLQCRARDRLRASQ
ncbi:hypothetical protein BaRGS_00006504 [Batillaria attramentaria]|uniref:Secreted protein n=1 Tax=Batillaria attramentaria TaxID=370345 RepID=A0ABD0LS78_9CAEN